MIAHLREQRVAIGGLASQTHVHDDPAMAVPNRAVGYRQGAAGRVSRTVHTDLGRLVGTTGVLTTVRDLLRWQRNFTDARVGEPALLAAMQAPMVLAAGKPAPYGFGLWIEPDGDQRDRANDWPVQRLVEIAHEPRGHTTPRHAGSSMRRT